FFSFLILRCSPRSTLFPYTTLFRSCSLRIYWLVYVCCVVHILVKAKIYIEYCTWECVRCCYAVNGVGCHRFSISYCTDLIFVYVICLANTTYICYCYATSCLIYSV